MEEMTVTMNHRFVTLFDERFKFSLSLNLFAGWVDIAVFEVNAKSAPIIKIPLSPSAIINLEKAITKVLSNPETQAIDLGFKLYNQATATKEYKGSVIVARDSNKCIYFDVIGEKHKEPIRFYVITDKSDENITVNGMELPKQSATETGCTVFIRKLNSALNMQPLSIARSKEGSGGGNGGSQQKSTLPPVGDDIGF